MQKVINFTDYFSRSSYDEEAKGRRKVMSDIRLHELERRLRVIGFTARFWGRAEVRELARVLLPGETVEHCVNGSYEGGFALLVATDQRVLLIDKKPFYLTLEDIRFDMITEVDYNHRLLNATIFICTPNKALRFLGYNHDRLRKLFHFVQTRVMEMRQQYTSQVPMQPQQMPLARFSPYLLSQQRDVPVSMTPVEPASAFIQARHAPPVISAYTRLPLMSRQRRFLGSRAMNTSMPSMYQQ